jgi:acyl-coenzyme A synthetase/AMP-(fatty) acid ligase
VEAAEFVPVVLRDLVKYVESTDASLPHLKLLVAGSDSWYTSEYVAIGRLFGDGCRVVNSYGLTEATIDSTYFDGAVGDGMEDGLVPLGRAFANTELLVLDRHLQLVPAGIPGELCVAGVALARGYLERPDLTAERFVPHPFSRVPGARLYRTGDLARYRPDGTLELLGRIDNQVKLRGFRIELAEVESVLSRHEAVLEAVVMVREDQPGDRRLVAYVVVADAGVLPSALRAVLRAALPDYMVPAAIVVLAALPLTPNGKIDRGALPQPDGTRQIDQAFVSPRTGLERQLVSIWRDVLRLEQVGVTDNFFDLGGHSLLLIQLHARIVSSLQIELTVLDLFRYPTIGAIAASLSEASSDNVTAPSAQDRADRRRAVNRLRQRPAPRVVRGNA